MGFGNETKDNTGTRMSAPLLDLWEAEKRQQGGDEDDYTLLVARVMGGVLVVVYEFKHAGTGLDGKFLVEKRVVAGGQHGSVGSHQVSSRWE